MLEHKHTVRAANSQRGDLSPSGRISVSVGAISQPLSSSFELSPLRAQGPALMFVLSITILVVSSGMTDTGNNVEWEVSADVLTKLKS